MAKVLIIDDDPFIGELLITIAKELKHSSENALTLKEGMDLAREERFDVVFLDVVLPDGNGLDALSELQQLRNPPEVVIITGKGDSKGAELAINSGAWDYISKPASPQEYMLHMRRVLQYRSEKQASRPKLGHHNIVGRSNPIIRCLSQAAKAAESHVGVLILGETGTGKELFARAVHDNSSRRGGPFIIVDCASIPENLVESMLFGHERGAFTSADKNQQGLIAKADGGTLFLDEVGELPLHIQKSFLRVLQEHTYRPVGGHEELKSDFRLVAATNRDLDALVQNGRFRQDLLYRLQAFTIELPPLRQRGNDIRRLSRYYLNKLAVDFNTTPIAVSDEFLDALKSFSWPGNVRELFNVLEQVFTSNPEAGEFLPIHLPLRLRVAAAQAAVLPKQETRNTLTVIQGNKLRRGKSSGSATEIAIPTYQTPDEQKFPPLKEYREQALIQAEKLYLESLLMQCKANMGKAAKLSGLSVSRIYALLKKHKIKKEFILK
ncbi:sigma-54-dependent transcriptional regulator [Maridesulfovibrio hydrothermalis]|uniref:Putative two component, sigma54 specific, transcriptional regulator, Fis family n=1 Tax=Maridesulfovibrio hydrothermalis AM13 = DSM 14728 TaxID=1121451 RepID=L0RC33_9BACT|nr:sigma-54 dependent transcriptional regulator [Maridesulfovibrio hydrothermalis]CCO23116.1 putative two component, sigma54 specific, transcriptional regulator, Fis family [Maridesulfovibrio hydrothermalis AM13 = DSM 14728]